MVKKKAGMTRVMPADFLSVFVGVFFARVLFPVIRLHLVHLINVQRAHGNGND